MSRISKEKQQKIKEEILSLLFDKSPKALYTYEVAKELIRDEEFVKRLLEELSHDKLIIKISKNKDGIDFLARRRWQLSHATYKAYKDLV